MRQNSPPPDTKLQVGTGPSTRNEIRKAIQFLKYGKAAGRDVIPPHSHSHSRDV